MLTKIALAGVHSDEPPDEENVAQLMDSIREVGLITPISVVPKDNGYRVVERLGGDRLEALTRLGWAEAEVHILPAETEEDILRVELRSIDEALCRKKLSPADEAILTARRKEIYETLHPETKWGVAGGKARQGSATENFSFAESQARASGKTARSVRHAQARGLALGEEILQKVRGTSLDKGDELDALAALPEEKRNALVERALAGERVLAKNALKQHHRELREVALAGKQQDLPEKRYGVILADPPWRHEVYSRETGMDRAADNHYPTMGTEEISKLEVGSVAADDCVLFMWTTIPFLREAMRVLLGWGFEYKSSAVWVKDAAGTGYWFRQQHEILLVATRGNVPAPAPGTQWSSVIDARRGKHSEKPAVVYELIEAYFPHLPKIELFARAARDGWEAWGQEAPAVDPVAEGIDGEGEGYQADESGEHLDGDLEPESAEAGSEDRSSAKAPRGRGVGAAPDAETSAAPQDPSQDGEPGPAEGVAEQSVATPPREGKPRGRARENFETNGTGGEEAAESDPFAALTYERKPPPELPNINPHTGIEMMPEIPTGLRRGRAA